MAIQSKGSIGGNAWRNLDGQRGPVTHGQSVAVTHSRVLITGILINKQTLTWQMLMPRTSYLRHTVVCLLACLITGWPLDSSIPWARHPRIAHLDGQRRVSLGDIDMGHDGIRLNDPALGERLHHIFPSFPINLPRQDSLAFLQGHCHRFTLFFPFSSPAG